MSKSQSSPQERPAADPLSHPAQAPSVYEAFARTAARWRQRPFLCVLPETAAIYGDAAGEWSYAQVLAEVDALAQAYARAGYGHGHRVGLLLENRRVFFSHWFALNRLGVSVVPISAEMRASELEYLIGHSELILAVSLAGRHADLRAAAECVGRPLAVMTADETPPAALMPAPASGEPDLRTECALLYTSGTTGRPKGCMLSNRYFLRAGQWYAELDGLVSLKPGAERMLTPLPLNHMNAMATSAMAMVMTGGCLIALDRFHPRSWWQSVRESGATVVHYLGVMPAILMKAPEDASDTRHAVRFGFGAGVDGKLHAPFEARFGFPLLEAWAMTETGAGAVVIANHEPRHVGTHCFGKESAAIDVRLVADDGSDAVPGMPGELWVRSSGPDARDGFFSAYWKDPQATEEAWQGGWFHTGDIVSRGEDGQLHFVDRKKNVIRRSGENISAVDVETVLLQHPAVKSVAVAAVPDDVRGDEVLALVVPHAMAADTSARQAAAVELVQWALGQMAYYKVPGYVAWVDALPLTATNKIQRGEIRELARRLMAEADAVTDTRAMKKRQEAA